MTTDLEQRLREALHEDAERAHLFNPDGPPAPEPRPLTVDRRPRSSARKLVAVAAAIVLMVAASVAVIQNREPVPDVDVPAGLEDLFNDLTLGDAELFADIPPGTTVELPPGPLGSREPAAVVWTGTEMIVWGGRDAQLVPYGDGAAFDLGSGTWRTIAPAPIEARDSAQAAWTGTEMVVWGGSDKFLGGRALADGAAYNPMTDTWRRLSEAPIDGGGTSAVWTGEEVIFDSGALQMAAYDPETDAWRRLADQLGTGGPISSGETFLAIAYPDPDVVDYPRAGEDMGSFEIDLARYDSSSDAWEPVYDSRVSDTIVDVTDAAGLSRAVLVFTREAGAPVTVLDPAGDVLGTLPVPASVAFAYQATWAGEEVLFPSTGLDGDLGDTWWALNLATQTWRQFDADDAPPSTGLTLAVDAGVLIGWGPQNAQGVPASTGVVYRPPAAADDDTDTGDQPLEAVDELPAPGEKQPADAAAAEEQVQAAYTAIFDASQPQEGRAQLSERPEVWLAANQQLVEGQYGAMVQDLHAVVEAVVFTDPTHAAVRFQLITAPNVLPEDQTGDAMLVDGRWLVAITTTCDLVSIAGVKCDMSL